MLTMMKKLIKHVAIYGGIGLVIASILTYGLFRPDPDDEFVDIPDDEAD